MNQDSSQKILFCVAADEAPPPGFGLRNTNSAQYHIWRAKYNFSVFPQKTLQGYSCLIGIVKSPSDHENIPIKLAVVTFLVKQKLHIIIQNTKQWTLRK
jgi:hypothetical protein